MQRRSDLGYRQFERTPSTRPEGAFAPSSQASAYPAFQPPSSAMLAAPAHQQSFPDPAASRLAHSATRPTLPPLSQFTTRTGSQYGSAYDVVSTTQTAGAHHAPPHDYRGPPAYQSFPPATVHPGRPTPGPLHYGEPGAYPYTDPRLSPASRGSPQNPLKRRFESVQDRPFGVAPYPGYGHPTDPGESSGVHSSTTVSSPSTSTPGYPVAGSGPFASAEPFADVLGSSASRCVLHLRQQPRAARAGPDGKDRRPIDPPPVLQLMMTDFNPDSQADVDELQSQYVVHCRLVSANSPRRDVSTLTSLGENGSREIQRLLLGTSVSSPFHTKDDPDAENTPHHPLSSLRASRAPSPSSRFFGTGVSSESAQNLRLGPGPNMPGTFFIFADLSVRKAGEYRLEFSLMKMDPHFLSVGEKLPIIHKIASQPFRVVNAKDFDQVQPSTPLVRGLIERGAGFPLKLKKGTREGGRRRGARGEDDSGSEEDDGG